MPCALLGVLTQLTLSGVLWPCSSQISPLLPGSRISCVRLSFSVFLTHQAPCSASASSHRWLSGMQFSVTFSDLESEGPSKLPHTRVCPIIQTTLPHYALLLLQGEGQRRQGLVYFLSQYLWQWLVLTEISINTCWEKGKKYRMDRGRKRGTGEFCNPLPEAWLRCYFPQCVQEAWAESQTGSSCCGPCETRNFCAPHPRPSPPRLLQCI